MKINSINRNFNRTSFGLKISNTQGFDEFMQRARGINWNCSEEHIQDFLTKLENMHFAKEAKNDTSIIFSPAVKELTGYRTFPFPSTSKKFINEPCYMTLMPYTFYKTGNNAPRIANYAVPLNNSSLDDILVDIASNYAKYSYSNQ